MSREPGHHRWRPDPRPLWVGSFGYGGGVLTGQTLALTLSVRLSAVGATTPGATGQAGEVPISAPLAGDPLAGTYPILGDPSLGMPAASPAPSGGLLSELSNAMNQLGATQAIDLLKGVLVPSIMQAIKSAAPAVPTP